MTTLSFHDIQLDEEYNKGYDAGVKSFKKEYEKLFNASKSWLHIYESAFGTPDENSTPEYWRLRKLLKMPS